MNIILALIFAGAGVGVFFGFTDPLMTEVKAMQAKSSQLEQALSNVTEIRRKSEQLATRYREISDEDRARLVKMLPDQVDNVRLIIDLDGIAQRYGMSLRNVRIKDSSPAGVADLRTYGAISLNFSVTGSYDSLRKLLVDLEQSLRLVDVSSVTFQSSDRDLQDYEIEIITYWLK